MYDYHLTGDGIHIEGATDSGDTWFITTSGIQPGTAGREDIGKLPTLGQWFGQIYLSNRLTRP